MRGKYVSVAPDSFLGYLGDPPDKMPTIDQSSFKKVPYLDEPNMYEPLVNPL
jgi:hypothetical protein